VDHRIEQRRHVAEPLLTCDIGRGQTRRQPGEIDF
jgi:hypothetical protein